MGRYEKVVSTKFVESPSIPNFGVNTERPMIPQTTEGLEMQISFELTPSLAN